VSGGSPKAIPAALVMVLLAAAQVHAEVEAESKTVIGPRNVFLQDGANALTAGDAAEGVPLTLKGLEAALGRREQKVGHANLCAGYLLLNQASTALQHCDWVLDRYPDHWQTYNNRALVYLRLQRFAESEADIRMGQQLNPRSEKLKEVKGMYLDEVEPVDEKITIDDRRNQADAPSD
jgi:tetratricopeptide (TPR) repeat protein